MKINALNRWYLDYITRSSYRGGEFLLFAFLKVLSLLFAVIVHLRGCLYDCGFLSSFRSLKPVISVGNISWGGSGKTSLTIKLASLLAAKQVAVLRRGYGLDEEVMLKQHAQFVFSGKNRVLLAKNNQDKFDCFILDDGFQYRKLKRDIDIVVMASREFSVRKALIPASMFREPFTSLNRADIVVVNYSSDIKDVRLIADELKLLTKAPVFFADYKPTTVVDERGDKYSAQDLVKFAIVAVTAIGYPQGFFSKLKEFGVCPREEIIYPDHHDLTVVEIKELSARLKALDVTHIVVTAKDKNRFGLLKDEVTILVLEVSLSIDDESRFMDIVKNKLAVRYGI